MSISTINMVDAKKVILACLKANEPLALFGSPGMGKTALFESVAKEEKIGYIPNILSQKDPVDVGGMRVPDMKTGILKHFVPEDLPVEEPDKAKGFGQHPERGILHYDEINVVSLMMQATAYGIINERRVGLHRLKKGWVPMASGNLVTDRSAAQKLSLALGNRFNVQHVVPDLKSWLIQYGSEHVDTRGCAFLRFRPTLFYCLPVEKDEVRFPSARSWTKAFKFIDEEPKFRRKIFAGFVGDTAADDFEAFWRIMERAITFEQIVKEPKAAPIPDDTEIGLNFAVASMIARSVDRKTFAPAMIYVERMQKDYQAAAVQDITSKSPGLKNTDTYGAWAVKNQQLVL